MTSSPRRLIWAGFLGVFVWGSIAGLLGAILPGLRERADLSLAESGVLFVALSSGLVAARVLSIFPIAIMLGRLLSNFLLRRVEPQPVLIVSTLGAAGCFALILTTRDMAAASLGLFVAGLFMASIFPTTLGVLSGRFPEASGTALGLAITGGWLGSVAISPSFGFVAHRSDFWTAYLVVVASATAMVVVAVALRRQGTAAGASPAAVTLVKSAVESS